MGPSSKGHGSEQVQRFLTNLAVDGRVAASNPNRAKTLCFLVKEVLALELACLDGVESAKPPALARSAECHEVNAVLALAAGTCGLIAHLLYLRLMEAACLRV